MVHSSRTPKYFLPKSIDSNSLRAAPESSGGKIHPVPYFNSLLQGACRTCNKNLCAPIDLLTLRDIGPTVSVRGAPTLDSRNLMRQNTEPHQPLTHHSPSPLREGGSAS